MGQKETRFLEGLWYDFISNGILLVFMWAYGRHLTGFKLVSGAGWCWIMDNVPIEIRSILNEIEKALAAKLYYVAIAVSLSVPDICASLEFDPTNPEHANWKTYSRWSDANIGSQFKNLTGIDLYRLRCGVLHFGSFDHRKSVFDRVIFLGPESFIKAHDVIITVAPDTTIGGANAQLLRVSGRLLHMDVVKFCNTIMKAAAIWGREKSTDPNVVQNLPRLIRYRPEGMPPYSAGVPTIA